VVIVRRNLLTALLSVAGLTLAAWAGPVAAQAAPASKVVTCGQTLTSSARLANSLVGCSGGGLVIGADNITVDLAGHSISGVNAAGSEGIAERSPGVRIQNGANQGVPNEGGGIVLVAVTGNTVRGNVASQNRDERCCCGRRPTTHEARLAHGAEAGFGSLGAGD